MFFADLKERFIKYFIAEEGDFGLRSFTNFFGVGLSATQFWEKYYNDNAENGFDKFMEAKGEQNVSVSSWTEPDGAEEASTLGL